MDPFTTEQKRIADASGAVNDAYKVPGGFVQGTEGLVVPERLKRPGSELIVTGRVGEEMFRKVAEDIDKIERGNGNKESLNVTLSSFGGSVYYGFAVYDLIRSFGRKHNAPITITGYGPIMSMGAFIIQAGDIRRMPENSTMLIHPTRGGMVGRIADAEFELLQRKISEKQYVKVVADRVRQSGKNDITEQDISNIMHANDNNGTYFTAQEALDFGLIDEIV